MTATGSTVQLTAGFSLNVTTLSIGNGGTFHLLGALTVSNPVEIGNGGTFQVSSGGTTNPIDFHDNGTLLFDGSNSLVSNVSGTGQLVITVITENGTVLTVSSVSNTYTGATTIDPGAEMVAGSATGLSPNSAFIVNGTLDINGFNSTIGSLSGTGTVLNNGAGIAILDVGNDGTNTIFNGVLADGSSALGLTKSGTGTLTLAGNNTYSGGANVNGGTLGVNSDINLGTGPLSFDGGTLDALTGITSTKAVTLNAGGGTFLADPNTVSTLSGTIGGAGSLTKAGLGTLILTGVNTYSGGTNLNAGVIAVNNDANLGGGPLSFDGGTLEALTGIASVKAVTLNAGGGTFLADPNTVSTLSGTISGAGTLTKSGAGTLVLAGVNTYTGGTNVLSGTLQAGSASGFSPNSGFTVNSILDLNGFSNTIGSLSGTGIVLNNGATAATLAVGNDNTTSTFDGSLQNGTSALGLIKIGTGTLILTGSNTYSGGTTISAGALQLGNGGTTGSITGDVIDNGVLSFNRSDVATFAGTISGAGSVNQIGTGTTILTANNTYTAGTTISAGTLQLGNGGTTGSITGDVIDNGVLSFNRNDVATFAGTISGAGSVNQIGAGTTILTANNTYTGGTTISAGTLQLGNGGTTGSITGDVIDNGVLSFNRSDVATFAGTFSGAGSVNQIGIGTTILTATNTYTGGTTISAGILQLGSGGTTGSITGDVIDNGVLSFNRSDSVTFAGTISGAGSVNQIGIGTTILTANNTYTGGTTISAGTLQLGNGAITGSIVGDVIDSGVLSFNRSDVATFAGTISGAGSVNQIGTGTTILTANNTYTAGTTISAGTLQLGNGGTTGSITGDVIDNGVLSFNRNDVATFAGTISGAGSVNQIGTGTTILTANNTYTGGTTISAGTLQLGNGGTTGSIIGDVIDNGVLSFNRSDVATFAGTFSGAGSVNQIGTGTTILTASIGTLTINGSLGLNSGSTLNYNFGQAGVVGGPFNDLAVVNGNLTLAGTLNVALTPGGTFDPGIYRVISYAGTLTDNGLALGSVPPGTTEVVQTSVSHEVNLVNTTGLTLNYWDGAAAANKNNGVVDGGNGTWQNSAGNDNWTNVAGALNAPWANAAFAIFEAAPGTVAVDNSLGQVVASGMQFAVSGYTVSGEPITLVETEAGSGATVVRVGDGTAAGTEMTAIIASVLQGSTRLVKDDLGTLVLSGANTYTGGTTISAGTLQLGNGGTTGSITGDVIDNGVELQSK